MEISFGGLATGLDTNAIISALLDVERIPILRAEQRRNELRDRNSIYGDLRSQLGELETALRDTKRSLSSELMDQADDPMRPCEDTRDLDASVKQINDLLGRLHNQKVFFRPRTGAYVGG